MSIRNGSIFSTTLLAVFGLILLGVAFCEANKAYWDYRVKEMCDKDGGVTVYETIILTKEQYERNDGRNNTISVMPTNVSKEKHQYAYKAYDLVINETNPNVVRSEHVTYRKSDNKTLGKWVTYSRRGGDFPIGLHPSSFGCQDLPNPESGTIREIFIFKGE